MSSSIWYTGAYGVKLNLLKDFFGAILMERSDRFSWTGDAFTSQAASLLAFGNYDFVLTNLHHTAEQDNGILSYSMYWIQSLMDYYQYTGDTVTLIHYIDNSRFKLDRAYKMLCIDSWLDFSRMMESIGHSELASTYKGYAKEKITELRDDPAWYQEFGIHAAADAINAGFTSEAEQEAMFREVFSDRLNRVSYSPFNEYFIIQALARMGRYDEAMETIGDCWGGQLDYGATSFFEVFRPSWNKALDYNDAPPNNQCGYTSFCHPWGGGVVNWLSEEILGIKPAKPGFSEFDFMPHPGSGLTRVSGSVPTPKGVIDVAYDVDQGRYEISIPGGQLARIGIPFLGRKVNNIDHNGKTVYSRSDSSNPLPGNLQLQEGFIVFQGIEEGKHLFKVTYQGESLAYEEAKWIYPAGKVEKDSITGGNWGGRYGFDGYTLCAYLANGDTVQDLQRLPSYVSNINYSKQLGMQWISKWTLVSHIKLPSILWTGIWPGDDWP